MDAQTLGTLGILAITVGIAILVVIGLATLLVALRIMINVAMLVDLFIHRGRRVRYTLEKVPGPESAVNAARSGSKK